MKSNCYELIADDGELKWWFDHIHSECDLDDAYEICLSARSKKLDEDERKKYMISRCEMMKANISTLEHGIWNYDIWKQSVYSYNVDKRALLTKTGLAYPEKCLVVYDYLNPTSISRAGAKQAAYEAEIEAELVNACVKFSAEGIREQLAKLIHANRHIKSSFASSISKRNFSQYDIDLDPSCDDRNFAYSVLYEKAILKFGKGNFFIVSTAGGFHIVVKNKAIHFNPNEYIEEVIRSLGFVPKEFKKANEGFVPCPGTLQYGSWIVTVMNKKDFEE